MAHLLEFSEKTISYQQLIRLNLDVVYTYTDACINGIIAP